MVGDKVYLADKPTLDRVDATTADTKGKVGTTVDVGGSASAGSVLGKLNAVIAYLLGHVTTSLTNIGNYSKRLNDLFTDGRVAKIDTIDANVTTTKSSVYNAEQNSYQASVNTATNNTASATGTLSQKLSKIIADMAASTTKYLQSKRASVALTANTTVTVLDVVGAGIFYGGYSTNLFPSYCAP